MLRVLNPRCLRALSLVIVSLMLSPLQPSRRMAHLCPWTCRDGDLAATVLTMGAAMLASHAAGRATIGPCSSGLLLRERLPKGMGERWVRRLLGKEFNSSMTTGL